MSRNYVGSGMILGLALLTGCTLVQYRPDACELTRPGAEALRPVPDRSQSPVDRANLQAFAPPPPSAAPFPTIPEAFGVQGTGPQSQQGPQPGWVAPAGARTEVPPVVPAATHGPPSGPLPSQDSCYGHAADYSWLLGELEYLRSKNLWRLRYAPADQEDRHGGTVLLVADSLPSDCKSGQVVRIEGQLVNPESDEPRPPYWVRTLQVLKAAPAVPE